MVDGTLVFKVDSGRPEDTRIVDNIKADHTIKSWEEEVGPDGRLLRISGHAGG